MTTPTISSEISKRAGWAVFMGVLTALIGAAMIVYPLATATASTVFLGSALLIAAGAHVIFAFHSQTVGSFVGKLLTGLLYGLAGIGLLAFPGLGVLTLTVVLGAMLIADAILETGIAFSIPAGTGRGWFFFSGLMSLLLGIMVLAEWPSSSIWAIGTMVGAAVLFNGVSRAAIAGTVRSNVRQFKAAAAA